MVDHLSIREVDMLSRTIAVTVIFSCVIVLLGLQRHEPRLFYTLPLTVICSSLLLLHGSKAGRALFLAISTLVAFNLVVRFLVQDDFRHLHAKFIPFYLSFSACVTFIIIWFRGAAGSVTLKIRSLTVLTLAMVLLLTGLDSALMYRYQTRCCHFCESSVSTSSFLGQQNVEHSPCAYSLMNMLGIRHEHRYVTVSQGHHSIITYGSRHTHMRRSIPDLFSEFREIYSLWEGHPEFDQEFRSLVTAIHQQVDFEVQNGRDYERIRTFHGLLTNDPDYRTLIEPPSLESALTSMKKLKNSLKKANLSTI